ncbi:hypothetical protein ED208_05110 [Stagnimonas aquatica]|uniref:AAA+ ATPase domain-containing protein n=1 Tax=Stagnimonas aquatica TaxID=2689987 RepID=A0A3N0VG77_9GAMM|nr:TniB family NTP-binding protein [Stagnimonas aquatica]ROH91767.1 hypothetical protein ED208_05110 [Stagnimonas aquatica]
MNTYDTTTLSPDCAAANDLPPNEALLLERLSSAVINHPEMAHASRLVDSVIAMNRHYSEPRHLLVIGDSGCGKSTLCDLIENRYGTFDQEFRLGVQRNVGALMTSVPSPVTPRSMAIQMLRSMGITRRLNQPTQALTEELIEQFRQCDVRVVVLDEFQHLLSVGEGGEKQAPKQLRQVQDWIKTLIVKSGVSFILLGLPSSTALLLAEDQMSRRFNQIFRLRAFPMPAAKKPSTIGAFVGDLLFCAVNELSFFDDAVSFEDQSYNALRIHLATGGVPGPIKDLVINAARHALVRGDRIITLAHFASAYESVSRSLETQNEVRRENGEPGLPTSVINPFTAPEQWVLSQAYQKAA